MGGPYLNRSLKEKSLSRDFKSCIFSRDVRAYERTLVPHNFLLQQFSYILIRKILFVFPRKITYIFSIN